jgi:hypothetical protein
MLFTPVTGSEKPMVTAVLIDAVVEPGAGVRALIAGRV